MKFGKTYDQITEDHKDRTEQLANWHNWFAWYPVDLKDGRFVWLQTIERKHKYWPSYMGYPSTPSHTLYREKGSKDYEFKD